jgi:hypothetical protein
MSQTSDNTLEAKCIQEQPCSLDEDSNHAWVIKERSENSSTSSSSSITTDSIGSGSNSPTSFKEIKQTTLQEPETNKGTVLLNNYVDTRFVLAYNYDICSYCYRHEKEKVSMGMSL